MIDHDIKILVNDDLIARYRSVFGMNARQWQDQHVRSYATALSRALTIACMMDWQDHATQICAWMARLEPMEAIREDSYEGALLWIVYNAFAVRDMAATRNAIDAALVRWPEDERLLRMRERVQPAIPLLPKPGK